MNFKNNKFFQEECLMNKPYIVCHMMTSVDGRIDCTMTEHLPGVQEYYDTVSYTHLTLPTILRV